MKHWTLLAALILVTVLLTYPACGLVKAPAPSAPAGTAVSSEPLTGNWAMTRTGMQPPLPAMIPGFVGDQIFPKTPTWSIGASSGTLTIKYDNKALWFNAMGINVSVKPTSASEATDKNSCTFSGGGGIEEDRLPAVLSMVGGAAGNLQNISIGYTDKVTITQTSPGQINATITYNASGAYNDNKGAENFNYAGTLTYTGTRK
jgi:hypothetical protein